MYSKGTVGNTKVTKTDKIHSFSLLIYANLRCKNLHLLD